MKISLKAGLLLGAGMLTAFSSVAFADFDVTTPMQIEPMTTSYSSEASGTIDAPLVDEVVGQCTCGALRIEPTQNNETCQASKRSQDDTCVFISGNNPRCICTEYTTVTATEKQCNTRNDIFKGITCEFRPNL